MSVADYQLFQERAKIGHRPSGGLIACGAPAAPRAASLGFSWSLPDAPATVGPPLLFAIRLWASVCLALFIAFWLELDSPDWAGGTAAIVCQPQLGASLRKGWFGMIGTIVGALVIVVLTGCFPQDRIAYLRLL